MDAFDAIRTKLDIREFSSKQVGGEIRAKVLEAARLTGSSRNTQHWRFVLVQAPANLDVLARDSTTGSWVKGANFAVIVSIDSKVPGSTIDAGRVIQDMQLAAWEQGVASGVYTGMKPGDIRRDFGVPEGLDPAAVVGFGYPKKRLLGRKSRKPLSEIAFLEKYGNPLGSLGK
ncbi:MAG: nitroreductase family protein [Thaumarchaeota archaeon]|nr:nitroreductase family protein [Nitrososphaerota archaeon]